MVETTCLFAGEYSSTATISPGNIRRSHIRPRQASPRSQKNLIGVSSRNQTSPASQWLEGLRSRMGFCVSEALANLSRTTFCTCSTSSIPFSVPVFKSNLLNIWTTIVVRDVIYRRHGFEPVLYTLCPTDGL